MVTMATHPDNGIRGPETRSKAGQGGKTPRPIQQLSEGSD